MKIILLVVADLSRKISEYRRHDQASISGKSTDENSNKGARIVLQRLVNS